MNILHQKTWCKSVPPHVICRRIPRLIPPLSPLPPPLPSPLPRGSLPTMIYLSCVLLLICLAMPVLSDAGQERSRAQVRAFLQQQGLEQTPEGYEVDHIVPLCAGGRDAPENMQLLTREQHREKTRHDLRRCWKLRNTKERE